MDKTVQHPLFGNLKYDENMQWYVGVMPVDADHVDCCISAEDENSFVQNLQQLEIIYKQLDAINNSALDYATDQLLEEKNSEWLAAGEEPLTAENFRQRLALESIIVGSGSVTEFFYDDDGIFFDHAILLTRHNDGLWISAEIAD